MPRIVVAALVVAAACVVGGRSAAGQTRADRQSEQLVGPVRVVTGVVSNARQEGNRLVDDGSTPRPIDTVAFDTAGRITTRDIIDTYGFDVGRETYRYEGARLAESILRDRKGTVLERRSYTYAAGVEPSAMTVVSADNKGYAARYARTTDGRLERITYVVNGAEMGHTAFTYEQGADPADVAFFLATGAKAVAPVGPCLGAHRITFRYEGGKVTEQVLFEPHGAEKRRSIYTYDAAGNVASETRSEPFGETRITHVYAYDRRGNWISRTTTVARTDRFDPSAPRTTSVSTTRRTLTYE
jgi:hypothetical protein